MLNVRSELVEKLNNKAYRDAYVEAQLTVTIPHQIRALRKERGWTQQDLAAAAGMKQSQISRAEMAGQDLPSTRTLLRIASAFDVALLTWFVSYSELISREQSFEPDAFVVPNFVEDRRLEHEIQATTPILFVDQGRAPAEPLMGSDPRSGRTIRVPARLPAGRPRRRRGGTRSVNAA